MPLYEYECPKCGKRTTTRRAVEQRDHPAACFHCWDEYHGEPKPMKRLLPSGVAIQIH